MARRVAMQLMLSHSAGTEPAQNSVESTAATSVVVAAVPRTANTHRTLLCRPCGNLKQAQINANQPTSCREAVSTFVSHTYSWCCLSNIEYEIMSCREGLP